MLTPGYEKIEGRWRKKKEAKRCLHCQKLLPPECFFGSKQYCNKCPLYKRRRDNYAIKVGKMCPMHLSKNCSAANVLRRK